MAVHDPGQQSQWGDDRWIEPECLAKLVLGAVEFAQSYGFPPHPDFRHASRLLAGIDPAGCSRDFRYGVDGKPFYMQGPHESPSEARVIAERVAQAGGRYVAMLDGGPLPALGSGDDDLNPLDEDE